MKKQKELFNQEPDKSETMGFEEYMEWLHSLPEDKFKKEFEGENNDETKSD